MFGVSTLCIAFLFIIFTGLSLVYAEMSQYATYASARTYFASHKENSSRDRTLNKYNELRDIFDKTNWFNIGINGNPLSPDIFITPSPPHNMPLRGTPKKAVFGIYTEYTSQVFGMKIPFLKDSSNPMFFPTATILGKESDQNHCVSFTLNLQAGLRAVSVINQSFFRGGF